MDSRRLSPCIIVQILAAADILSLLRCRLVSRRFKTTADSELRVDMRRIISRYLPAPEAFLDALVKYGAVVSSVAALALFLRDDSILNGDLEICVRHSAESAFNEYVRTSLPVVEVWSSKRMDRTRRDEESSEGRPHRRTWTYKVKGRSKRYIRVVGCAYPSPLGAINSLCNSALLCFFSPILMGCAYPSLTLRRLALHRDLNMRLLSLIPHTPLEFIRNIALVSKGDFQLSWNPRNLINPIPTATCHHGQGCPHCRLLPPCVRQLYLCGCNIRYWGDRGCLMAVLDAESAWRDLVICPDEEGTMFTPWEWNWQRCGTGDGYTHDPLEEEMDDWNCVQGESRIRKLTIHIAPNFAGEEMLYTSM